MSGDHHSQPHEHAWRDSHAAPGSASVLDIGGDVGAIVVCLVDDTASGELMACVRGNPTAHFHTGVHLRSVDGDTAWVAVFPDVTAGDYSLLTDNGIEHTPFEVFGGQVTSLDLSATTPPQPARRR